MLFYLWSAGFLEPLVPFVLFVSAPVGGIKSITDISIFSSFNTSSNCNSPVSLTNLYNSGWVYQFNAIPQNELGRDRSYWMKRIYEELYN